jgi:hypothetical protein
MNFSTTEGRMKSFTQLNWPHLKDKSFKLVNEEKVQAVVILIIFVWKMAMAGFYCRPLTGSEDNVCCFMCAKNLDGWQQTDEAWAEHVAHASTCPLTTLHLQASRLVTFDHWPHQRPNASTMSQAGFFYYPRTKEDDTAYCYQCGLGLDGWEEGDDPLHEHSRRRPTCPAILKKEMMEPAAYQRILGCSTLPYIKEIPVDPKEKKASKEIKEALEQKISSNIEKENMPPPSHRKARTSFTKPIQKNPPPQIEEDQSWIDDVLNASNGIITREDLDLSLEDFVLKTMVQRELLYFDSAL